MLRLLQKQKSNGVTTMPKAKSGERFKKLAGKLGKKGADDPKALAAWIGRKKYGKDTFARLAAKAKMKV